MSKSYRYDPDGNEGFDDRAEMKRARKQVKANRRQLRQEQLPAEIDTTEEPFDVMSTITPNDWSR